MSYIKKKLLLLIVWLSNKALSHKEGAEQEEVNDIISGKNKAIKELSQLTCKNNRV